MKQLVSNLQGTAINLIKTGREIYSSLNSKEYEGNADLLVQKKIDLIIPIAENMQRNVTQDPSLVQLPTNLQESIDSAGSDIWNLGGQLNVNKETLHGVKYFAIVLLLIYESFNPSIDRSLSVLSCLINLLSSSISTNVLGVAKKCQNFAETILNKLLTIDRDCNLDKDNKSLIDDYNSKFLLLSLSFEVVSGNYETAKVYEARLSHLEAHLAMDFVLETSRILYNSALDLYNKETFETAKCLAAMSIKFLEKVITEESQGIIKTRYLQTYILLIKCYKSLDTNESKERALSAVKLIQNQFSTRFEVYGLYFEICGDTDDTSSIDEVMMRMVMSVPIADNFEKVLNLLKQKVHYSFKGVNNCLDFLLTNLDSSSFQAGVLVITKFVVNAELAQKEEPQIRIKELELFIELAERSLQHSLDMNMKQSVLALLWKQGMAAYKALDYDQSSGWLRLSLSRLFYMEYSENQDRGKIIRAIENNHLLSGNAQAVLDLHQELGPEDESSMLSQYNLFRAFTLMKDEGNASAQFTRLVDGNTNINAILAVAACIIEATNNLSNDFIKNAFLQLLNILSSREFNEEFIQSLNSFGIILPICCRCAILMFSNNIEKNEMEYTESNLLNLCQILKGSCNFATHTSHVTGQIFNSNDYEWCASKAYNIALFCKQINRCEIAVQLCQICIGFIHLIPPDIEKVRRDKMIIWKTRAMILTFFFLSKKEDIGVDDWTYIKEHGVAMIEEIRDSDVLSDDSFECIQQLCTFRFQAELIIGSTEQIQAMIEDCSTFKPKHVIEMYEVYVNLLIYCKRSLAKHAKSSILLSIINRAIGFADATFLPRLIIWIRYFMEISDDTFDSEKGKAVLQFYRMYQSNVVTAAIPSFEIEWIASVSWNYGALSHGLRWCAFGVLFSRFVHERVNKQPTGSTKLEVPKYHPSLIVHDYKDDLTKVKTCGCSGPYCVKNVDWIPQAK
ncbi:SPO22 [Candida margitis]|uniref:SPO22 n=1 Tax=Candida margitis TaxID=1775924 RepID=UPI002226C43A|nr:SPO22 [Candida margitis]KAI5958414.1 SPO22 [Candida margitis]